MSAGKSNASETVLLVIKCIVTVFVSLSLPITWVLFWVFIASTGAWDGFAQIFAAMIPGTIIPLLFAKKRKWLLVGLGSAWVVLLIALWINLGVNAYNQSLIIDTAPNINVNEYLPFEEDSKIVELESEASLQLTEDLPVVDGAAAVFPVYSAFVNAVYPSDTKLNDGVFQYNNTVTGYELLAQKQTDIFFGAYPSDDQIRYAESRGTQFVYTPIGNEAFVFFVHKDNPVDNLTSEQLRGIYSGQITNWKEVGGRDEPIVAYQRNEGSGSQSRLIRFMDGTELMEPPTDQVESFMDGIIEEVADYRSKPGSIGFSFRYYVEGIIQNPNIKLLSIDGVAPTVENIKNGSYPLVEPLYAVTWENNSNENVDALIQWILSDEGQYIVEKTGYAGVAPDQ